MNRTRPGRSPREGRGWFVLRRAHSLAGVVFLGIFLVGHLLAQSHAMWLAASNGYGDLSSSPLLTGAWRALVLAPLAFHAFVGLWILSRTRFNVVRYPLGSNWTYTLQRVTAILALAFLLLHAVDVVLPLARGTLSRQDVYRAMTARLSSTHAGVPWWALGYMLGMGACAFHLGAGVRSAARSLGLATRRAALARAALLGALTGLATLWVGANTIILLATGSAAGWPWRPRDDGEALQRGMACPDTRGEPSAGAAPSGTARPAAPRPAPRPPPSAAGDQPPPSD